MPISAAQSTVLRVISKNRSPDSYVAGATVLHRDAESSRTSIDLDLFHDLEEQVSANATTDVETLQKAGFTFEWLLRTPAFHRGLVTVDDEKLQIEWAQDSAFRFFPIQEDDEFGYRLHDADAAVNKLLALAGRTEARDFVDVLSLNSSYLSLGTLAWAAGGKDPGYTPALVLEQAARHAAYTQTDIDRLLLAKPLDVSDLKGQWIAALEDARQLVASLPAHDLGCLYLNHQDKPVTPDPSAEDFNKLIRHEGCVYGAWPTILPENS